MIMRSRRLLVGAARPAVLGARGSGLEGERGRVDAVALACGPGTVVEDVTEVPPQRRQTTSVRRMKRPLSGRSSTASATAGSVKLGQPVPDSNLVSEPNSSAPHAGAAVVAGLLVVDVLARERRLGAGAAQDLVLLRRQLLTPLPLGFDDLGSLIRSF